MKMISISVILVLFLNIELLIYKIDKFLKKFVVICFL